MKTSNLIITTLSLCSLLLSSVSIFGMETKKRRNEKKRTYVDVAKKGIRVTTNDRTIEIDSEPSDQRTDSDEESTTTDTATVTTTPLSTNDSNTEKAFSSKIATWFKDSVWSQGANVLSELEQSTFCKNNTSDSRRLEKAIEEFSGRKDKPNHKHLVRLLKLCQKQNISIDSRLVIKSAHQFLKKKKAEQEKELVKVITTQRNNIATQANKQLKQLQEEINTGVKKFTDLMQKMIKSLDEDIENHCKEIRIVKYGQILTHQINTVFEDKDDDGYDSDDNIGLDCYDNCGILEKTTVNKSDLILNLSKDISQINYTFGVLSKILSDIHSIRNTKAITEQ